MKPYKKQSFWTAFVLGLFLGIVPIALFKIFRIDIGNKLSFRFSRDTAFTDEQRRAISQFHDFADHRLKDAVRKREMNWEYDFSSKKNYLSAVEEKRKKLVEIYGIPSQCMDQSIPQAIVEELSASINGARLYGIRIEVCKGYLPTLYSILGVPSSKKNKALPLMIAVHGTAGSPERIFGLDKTDDYHHMFAKKLLEEGYMVFAPVLVTRNIPDESGNFNKERNEIDNRNAVLGYRLIGLEMGQIMSAINYLVEREDVDRSLIGIYGISLGGLIAFNLAAIDTRIGVAVISQYYENLDGKLAGMNYRNAYWRYENSDYSIFEDILLYFSNENIASLMVPRKLMIEAGSMDVRAKYSKDLFPEIKRFYEALRLPEGSCELAIENGGHEAFLNRSLEFLNRWLKGNK